MASEKYNVVGKTTEELIAKAAELKLEIPEGISYNDLRSVVYKAANPPVEDESEKPAEKPAKKPARKVYKDENGNVFRFKSYTPKSFRYEGKLRTQKEWLSDSDAMERMIESRIVYVEPII